MIEVELDFKKINTEQELILYLRKELGLPYEDSNGNINAFIDDFRILRIAEYETFNDIDEWKSKEEWEEYKKVDAQYGLKNKRGVRDNLLLIFINFRKFYLNHLSIATNFLEIIFNEIEYTGTLSVYEDGKDILDIQIIIKS